MTPTVSVEGGVLQGVRAGDVLHYRGIPYAIAERFMDPGPAPSWQGVRDAGLHGPICPQPPFRLASITGAPAPAPQDEACLTLSVSTPVAAGDRPRPVMVWLHGGAYAVGAGSDEWYRPDHLVTEGDVIVVNVNYRLGALGYLRLDGASAGHRGFLDQIAALRWVAKNIAGFGGDPNQVTVFGESAGGHSITALMSTPETRGLFRRAIVQSGHLGLGFVTAEKAESVAQVIRDLLGGADPRAVPVERLLAVQQAAALKFAGRFGLNSSPIFGPIAGVPPLPEPAEPDIAAAVIQPQVDLLIGTTRDEMRAFFDANPRVVRFRRVPILGNRVVSRAIATITERVFGAPAKRLADAHAAQGAAVYTYLFEWTPTRDAHGACHMLDLPFVFGNEAAWRNAPMLGEVPWNRIDAFGRRMRRAWTRFAHIGDPNSAEDPPWGRHLAGAEPGRRFR